MEIKANELRIGNFVKHIVFGDVPIYGILHESLKTLYEGDEYWDDLKYHEAIPLTEEWLLKFSFEKYEFDHKANQFRFKERLVVYREDYLHDYGTSVKLEYVHQLQNLYFALTGEELIIK